MNKQVTQAIEKMVYERDGQKFIKLGNYALDFKSEYVFLGFTKSKSKVILGDIFIHAPPTYKYSKRFGKIEKDDRYHYETPDKKTTVYRIVTDGHRYSEDIPGTEGLD